ncbi:MAG: ABC transporter permease [Candidatus Cloacimonetes bacterium HGW-Cloacimonetes-1]|jgi:ABC-2 type transport system permease protein|nr:MAG: ABC transporter permease [Candidatus Cloacimonetes bacterium HGW-Cloacimonetes-1]
MSIRVLFSFVKKEIKQIFRTKEMLILMFGAPLLQLLVLGFTVTNEVKHIKLFIEDRDNTELSRAMCEGFKHTDRFDLVQQQRGESSTIMIQNWEAQLVVIVPQGFGRELRQNRKPDVQFITDGLDGNSAAVSLGYAQGIVARFIQSMLQESRQKYPFTALSSMPSQVIVSQRMWYNEDLNSAQYMVPGIIVILITIISMMMSAMSLVKEKEIGTLEQLMVTPASKIELLLGKLIPYWVIAMFEISAVTFAAHFIFRIHFTGSVAEMALAAGLYLMTTLGIGIFISTITDTQQQAMFFSWFMMIFMILLSGLFVPVQNMPYLIKKLTLLNPMSFMLAITREVIIKGTPLRYMFREVAALTLYGFVTFFLGVTRFHKTTK